ncbi:hypothetical protein [Peribacillus butanolivorans]|nr:hypothetical protein [Peribacillus butanolivorans]
MYAFILGMWVRRKIIETQIRNYVPRYITAEEAETILATPQNEVV